MNKMDGLIVHLIVVKNMITDSRLD